MTSITNRTKRNGVSIQMGDKYLKDIMNVKSTFKGHVDFTLEKRASKTDPQECQSSKCTPPSDTRRRQQFKKKIST